MSTVLSMWPAVPGILRVTVKNCQKPAQKASDPYRALLAYRTPALANGYSPAQLLMGRRLHTTLQILLEVLQTSLPDLKHMCRSEREGIWQTGCFNKRHRTRDLDKLLPGQPVWITDAKAQGTVTSAHPTPRSYVISGLQGIIRRNRSYLVPILKSEIEPQQIESCDNTPTESVSEPKAQQTLSVVWTRSVRVKVCEKVCYCLRCWVWVLEMACLYKRMYLCIKPF